MTASSPRSHSVPPTPVDLRLSALGRRVSASGPLAIILTDLVYGVRERDHAETLHFTTGARIAEAVGGRS